MQGQQTWEAMLADYKQERDDLDRRIKHAEILQRGSPSPDLDRAKLRLIQLEVTMRAHFDYAYNTPPLFDAYMKNKQLLPLPRSDNIGGMIHTNFGVAPMMDVSTRRGHLAKAFLDALAATGREWTQLNERVGRIYDANKGDIRQLCEAGGDSLVGKAIGGALTGSLPRSPLPKALNDQLMGQLGDAGGKSMSPGRVACDRILGSKPAYSGFPF